MSNQSSFEELVAVMAKLRAPDGCPWDREQSHASLKPYLLEETYEALEAIDGGDDEELCSELGDVLLQVVFHAQIASEASRFDIDAVARSIVDKLIRRHPHVFGDVAVDGVDEVVRNWEEIKQQERQAKRADATAPTPSALDGIPKELPALMRAEKVQGRAAKHGFDWDSVDGPLSKIDEELQEFRTALDQRDRAETASSAMDEEFGDLLFSMVNTARHLGLDAEQALRGATIKFERRFRGVESRVAKDGGDLKSMSLAELDKVWEDVKSTENGMGG